MSIEQSILLEGYAQFVSKVERRPGLTLDDAKHWLMGDLMTHGFQVQHCSSSSSSSINAIIISSGIIAVTI